VKEGNEIAAQSDASLTSQSRRKEQGKRRVSNPALEISLQCHAREMTFLLFF
jgi:hypothetical protein